MPQLSRFEREISLEHQLQYLRLASGSELARLTGFSQATVSRVLAGMTQRLVIIGETRARQYALRREIRDLGSDWSLYRVLESGESVEFGHLTAFHGGFIFEPEDPELNWFHRLPEVPVFAGLPFFLTDARPQGFIGRAIAKSVPSRAGLPTNLGLWSDDHILYYLHEYGENVPGDIVVGERMLESAISFRPPDIVESQARAAEYPAKASRTLQGEIPGSSAGGEQPKFTAWVSTGCSDDCYEAIVKFSPSRDTPAGNRWSDLLICEYLANRILAREGFEVAQSELILTDLRVFLEARRFDRVGPNGRRGFITAEAVAASYLAAADQPWPYIAQRLEQIKGVSETDADRIRILYWFGWLIGNSDMHLENLAFWFHEDSFPFALAPLYDMLPMVFAPKSTGEIVDIDLPSVTLLPRDRNPVRRAFPMAIEFWETVIANSNLSPQFRLVGERCELCLHDWAKRNSLSVAVGQRSKCTTHQQLKMYHLKPGHPQ